MLPLTTSSSLKLSYWVLEWMYALIATDSYRVLYFSHPRKQLVVDLLLFKHDSLFSCHTGLLQPPQSFLGLCICYFLCQENFTYNLIINVFYEYSAGPNSSLVPQSASSDYSKDDTHIPPSITSRSPIPFSSSRYEIFHFFVYAFVYFMTPFMNVRSLRPGLCAVLFFAASPASRRGSAHSRPSIEEERQEGNKENMGGKESKAWKKRKKNRDK